MKTVSRTVIATWTISLHLWYSTVNAAAIPQIPSRLQNVLDNTHRSKGYGYPTDFTRGIDPKPFHSHNDYWREVPFYSALAHGAASVEADVWLYNDTLYVGHHRSSLTEERTFASLYVEPILDVLRHENPETRFVPAPTRNGVYDTSSGQTLYLFVDVKTNGAQTWPHVIEALRPLSRAGYLTTADGIGEDANVLPGPITVIGTGNAPLDWFVDNPGTRDRPREVFYDAHLPLLSTTEKNITSALSPIASTNFQSVFGPVVGTSLNDKQMATLREQIETANTRGIGPRYWNQPGWPIGTRNALWRLLLDEGVALLNVDDLDAIGEFWNLE